MPMSLPPSQSKSTKANSVVARAVLTRCRNARIDSSPLLHTIEDGDSILTLSSFNTLSEDRSTKSAGRFGRLVSARSSTVKLVSSPTEAATYVIGFPANRRLRNGCIRIIAPHGNVHRLLRLRSSETNLHNVPIREPKPSRLLSDRHSTVRFVSLYTSSGMDLWSLRANDNSFRPDIILMVFGKSRIRGFPSRLSASSRVYLAMAGGNGLASWLSPRRRIFKSCIRMISGGICGSPKPLRSAALFPRPSRRACK
mmetsp:Transcript_17539/g.42819  ORF Transcript_17539/g.42819 Transcript_17539/m.42819 type:complete len:254 (+) Transcript_17539:5139-5900(+)